MRDALVERYVAGETAEAIAHEAGISACYLRTCVSVAGRGGDRQRARIEGATDLAAKLGRAAWQLWEVDAFFPRRLPELVRARHAIMLVMRQRGYSYPSIGMALGLNHTTVMHGVDKALACDEIQGMAHQLERRLSQRREPRGRG